MDSVYPSESYKIMGACFEVYETIGCGFAEPVYQECLESELTLQGLPFKEQAELNLIYKGQNSKASTSLISFCTTRLSWRLRLSEI